MRTLSVGLKLDNGNPSQIGELRVSVLGPNESVMRNRGGKRGENPCAFWAFGPYHSALTNDLGMSHSKYFLRQRETQFEGSIWLGKFLSPEQHPGTANVFGGALPPLAFSAEPIAQVDLYSKALSTVPESQFNLSWQTSICFLLSLTDLLYSRTSPGSRTDSAY
jgi:hypothetical protein